MQRADYNACEIKKKGPFYRGGNSESRNGSEVKEKAIRASGNPSGKIERQALAVARKIIPART